MPFYFTPKDTMQSPPRENLGKIRKKEVEKDGPDVNYIKNIIDPQEEYILKDIPIANHLPYAQYSPSACES